ncbi:MAG TPA: GspH/FimT family pseudopilin [Ramlibacter sp.]|nr:GspH/FimT family pseudopilin [Ramlibacter sp.]
MKKASLGLTLVELLVVFVISAILVGLAAPGFKAAMARWSASSALDLFMSDLRYARAEAVKRGHSVTICRSGGTAGCVAADGDWQAGWLVFDDRDANGVMGANEAALRVQGALPGIQQILALTGATNTKGPYTFSPLGVTAGMAGNLVITASPSVVGGTRLVCISNLGRASQRDVGDTGC